jgi:hypothetical protein
LRLYSFPCASNPIILPQKSSVELEVEREIGRFCCL